MKNNYYIIRLTFFTLLKIILTGRKKVGSITYLKSTMFSKAFISIVNKTQKYSGIFSEIPYRDSVAGPVLNMSEVRNEKDEAAILDLYHEILKVRKKLIDRFLDKYKSLFFIKEAKTKSMIAANLGLKIAHGIKDAVYFAYYARWNNKEKEFKTILIIPKTIFNRYIITDLNEVVDKIEINKKEGNIINELTFIFKYLFKAFLFLFFYSNKGKKKEISDEKKNNRIMVTYKLGILKEKRNDISFFYYSKLDPKNLLIYLHDDYHMPSNEELDWINDNNIACVAGPRFSKQISNVKKFVPGNIYKSELRKLSKNFLNLFFKQLKKTGESLWLLKVIWEMGVVLAFWKDLYISNNVSVLINTIPSKENFIPNMALADSGGIAVELERSIRFDYCTYIHNAPNHVYFATGAYSFTQLPEPSFSLFTLISGGVNITENLIKLDFIDKLRSEGKKILTFFDEVPNDNFFGGSIKELYLALIDVLNKNKNLFVLIKTKKPHILNKMKDVLNKIEDLQKKNRCMLLDWKVNASSAVSYADIVLSSPSTAAFESIIKGKRTVLYNPMKSGSKVFYKNNGINRRIFEKISDLVDGIDRFVDGKNDELGQCSDIREFIDPFCDERGPERIGEYLFWLLEEFDKGQNSMEALTEANKKYRTKWDDTNVTDENSYEKEYEKK
jgi:hypothetical protein